MAVTNVPRLRAERTDFESASSRYRILREQMHQTYAVANALGMLQERDTHAFHLAELLDSRMSEAGHWLKLDAIFGVDHNGEPVEVNHG